MNIKVSPEVLEKIKARLEAENKTAVRFVLRGYG